MGERINPEPPPIKAPGQDNQMLVDGSPLAIVGIFVAVLRERFAEGNGIPMYQWDADPNKTKIQIRSAFEDGHTVRGDKPAIYIDKDETIYGKSVIGDRAGYTFKDSKDFQWCLATVPIIIDCVASRKGESAIIGDVTHWSLHASSDAIQAAFAFHDMSPLRLGRTVPYEDDKEAWTSPISFTVQYNMRWTRVPIAPLLQEIALKIQTAEMSPTDYLLELVTRLKDLPES
jgi:hypothetical protein